MVFHKLKLVSVRFGISSCVASVVTTSEVAQDGTVPTPDSSVHVASLDVYVELITVVCTDAASL